MRKMTGSEKNNLISKLFLILFVVELCSGPVALFLLIWFYANSISEGTMLLLMILIGIIWFIMSIVIFGLHGRFKRKHIACQADELGLREILEANMDLVEYAPLQCLPKQTLLDCSVIFPDEFFLGKIGVYGRHLICGKYNNKSFEMSDVQLIFTRNTAGRPEEKYFDGTIVILHPKTNAGSDILYMFPTFDRSGYKKYALRFAKLDKVMPSRIDNNWECFSHSRAGAERFYNEHSGWFSSFNRNFISQFMIYSENTVLLGIKTKLVKEDPDASYMRENFEQTLKRILDYCVDPFE